MAEIRSKTPLRREMNPRMSAIISRQDYGYFADKNGPDVANVLQIPADLEKNEHREHNSTEPFGDIIKHHDTAVILHLYYTEMREEIFGYLANLDEGFDLFVSIPQDADFPDEKIIEKHKHSYIYRCPNRGRDVAPFLKILSIIYPLNYKYVLKIHTKRSAHYQNGNIWRQDLYCNLAGSRELVRDIKQILDSHANVGIFAPQGHVVPHTFYWEQNAENVRKLTHMAGLPYENEKFQFVAGTMFWFRPAAFRPIIKLNITTRDFEPEHGQTDGTFAHAVERFFGLLMRHQGLHIVEFSEVGGEMNLAIAEKDGIIAARDGIIAERDGIIAERGRAVAERDMVIVEKDKLIAELEMKRIELESVLNSKSWKLTYPLRWGSARLKGIK
ncbi:MAG: rhamnan synthesis F family protein [Nitrospirota bacterium]